MRDEGREHTGTIYLLHFDRKLGGRRHYLGWTEDLAQRLKYHRAGQGGRTTAKYRRAGIGFDLAATWPGSLGDETRLKRKNLKALCPICKVEKMTVLEALQKMAGATRRVAASLSDLTKTTGATRYRVREELVDLLARGDIKILSKGDAARNKTLYEIAQFTAAEHTVRKDSALHSVTEQNRTVELVANGPPDFIQLSTVRSHSPSATSDSGSSAPSSHGELGSRSPLPGVAMPPPLVRFNNVRGLGRCLDATRHYIVDSEFLSLAVRNPEWSPKSLHHGTLRVLHIAYADSRVSDIFHAIIFLFDGDPEADTCSRKGTSTCRGHLLLGQVRTAFPEAMEVYAQPCVIRQVASALYDVRQFCPQCAGLSVPAGVMQGFEYVPAKVPTVSTKEPSTCDETASPFENGREDVRDHDFVVPTDPSAPEIGYNSPTPSPADASGVAPNHALPSTLGAEKPECQHKLIETPVQPAEPQPGEASNDLGVLDS